MSLTELSNEDLSILVAEKIFNFKRIKKLNTLGLVGFTGRDGPKRVKPYAEDIQAAFLVVEKMLEGEDGFDFKMFFVARPFRDFDEEFHPGGWYATFDGAHIRPQYGGDNPARAICIAALSVSGVGK